MLSNDALSSDSEGDKSQTAINSTSTPKKENDESALNINLFSTEIDEEQSEYKMRRLLNKLRTHDQDDCKIKIYKKYSIFLFFEMFTILIITLG